MTAAETRRCNAVAIELARQRIDRAFIRHGHKPENRNCDHKHWRGVSIDGRYCSCGTCMCDPGD